MAAFIQGARWEGRQPTSDEEKETAGLRTNFWRLHVNWLQGDTVTEQVRPRPAPVLSHDAFPGSMQGPLADDQGQGRDGAVALPRQGAQSSQLARRWSRQKDHRVLFLSTLKDLVDGLDHVLA